MSKLRIYLRRDNLDATPEVTKNRFFFLPIERITGPFSVEAIAPKLPGNTSSGLFGGTNSTNFMFPIGRQQMALHVEGTFQPLDAADYPEINTLDLTTATEYESGDGTPLVTMNANRIYEHAGTYGHTTGNNKGTDDERSARNYRDIFYKWLADQADTATYGNIRLGYGNWRSDGDANSPKYREFRGLVLGTPQTGEEAGYIDQYRFSFMFLVGDTIETTAVAAGA